MTEIKDWNPAEQLDDPNRFGWNDHVLVVDDRGMLPEDDSNGTFSLPEALPPVCPPNSQPAVGCDPRRACGEDQDSETDHCRPAQPLPYVATEQQVRSEMARIGMGGTIQATDQIFRMVRDGRTYFVLRRSRVSDECRISSRPNNSLQISEQMSQALSFFGARLSGSDPSGDQWCRRHVNGLSEDGVETPWDLTALYNLRSIEEALSAIREAKGGTIPTSLGHLNETDRATALRLAGGVPETELTTLAEDVRIRRERLEGFGEWFMRHPVLHTLGIAILFGAGTDVFHILRFMMLGGQNPISGGGGIFTNVGRSLIHGEGGFVSRVSQGIRNWWRQGPPGGPGPSGGTPAGDGQSSSASASKASAEASRAEAPAQAPAEEEAPAPEAAPAAEPAGQRASSRMALPNVARGILAYHGHATAPGAARVPVPGRVVARVPAAVPGIAPVPVVPVPVAIPAPAVAPAPVIVPRFVPAPI